MPATTGIQARRAVVIEDDPEIRALYRPVLERLGLEAVMTSNGADGVAAVAEFSPLVTFLDVSMSGMDGFATVARIREFSDTYVLMISAHHDEIDVVQGLGAGADDYVFKPFRPRELRARVEALLRRPPRLAASSTTTDTGSVAAATTPAETDLWRPDASPAPTPHPAPSSSPPPGVAAAALRSVGSEPLPAPGVVPHLRRPSLTPRHDTMVAGANAVALRSRPLEDAAPEQTPTTSPVAVADSGSGALHHGALALDLATARVSLGDQHVDLDASEVNLLASLMETGTRVRSTANLVLALRGESYVTTYFVSETDKRNVVETMDTLRRRMGDTGPVPLWIEPVGTVGFRMTPA